jgi:hypothetical protein
MASDEIKLNSTLFQDNDYDNIKDLKVDLDKIFFNPNVSNEDQEFETSINSKAIFSYDAPAINRAKSKFIYNFFVED